MNRKTKIIATLGPASGDAKTIEDLLVAGVDVFRLNLSHGTEAEHNARAGYVRTAADKLGKRVGLLVDIPGPKIRLGELADGRIDLESGPEIVLIGSESLIGKKNKLPVQWLSIADAVQPGDTLYLADGAVKLKVTKIVSRTRRVTCIVEAGGAVSSKQGVNLPIARSHHNFLSETDKQKIEFAEKIEADFIALSFVQRADDVHQARKITSLPLIAKIEKPLAMKNIEELVEAADGVMIARGDLGIEMDLAEVPFLQKEIIRVAGQHAKPSITATQMLESMINADRPTRAEVTDVANAILDGSDAIMLSGETAIGNNPVRVVEVMDLIAKRAERSAPHAEWLAGRVGKSEDNAYFALAFAACGTAQWLDLAAILVPTETGRGARIIAAHRPTTPVLTLSSEDNVLGSTTLLWGVNGAKIEASKNIEDLTKNCITKAKELGLISKGDRVAVIGALHNKQGKPTNTLLVEEVS